jgi:hypothetical protein
VVVIACSSIGVEASESDGELSIVYSWGGTAAQRDKQIVIDLAGARVAERIRCFSEEMALSASMWSELAAAWRA